MSVKPILFNTEMVNVILDGRKTVTRRVIKPVHLQVLESQYHIEHPEVSEKILIKKLCDPPYKKGDILYVRETWNFLPFLKEYIYKADAPSTIGYKDDIGKIKWRPSIHMPKEAARIWLRVTDVQVERLQEITIDGIQNEGIDTTSASDYRAMTMATMRFSYLWNSTIKKADRSIYSWNINPWVWVIDFERCEKPELYKGE